MENYSLIEVDISKLQTDTSNMKDKVKEINTDMDKMFTEILSLSNMWKGEASDTFKTQFTNDQNKFREIMEAINKVTLEFEQAAKDYIQCENDVAAEINSIKIGK